MIEKKIKQICSSTRQLPGLRRSGFSGHHLKILGISGSFFAVPRYQVTVVLDHRTRKGKEGLVRYAYKAELHIQILGELRHPGQIQATLGFQLT